MKPDVKCSRCGFVVHGDDKLYDVRKKRHADGRHTPHTIRGERPQHNGQLFSKAMGGLDIGKVSWYVVT